MSVNEPGERLKTRISTAPAQEPPEVVAAPAEGTADHEQLKALAGRAALQQPAVLNTQHADEAAKDALRRRTLSEALPLFWFGFPICLVLTLIIGACQAASSYCPYGLSEELLLRVPLQIYWTFCLYRLSVVSAAACNSKPPVSPLRVAVNSFIAWLCGPSFYGNFIPHLFDPLFFVFVASQLAFPLSYGSFMQKSGNQKFPWALVLSLASCGYLALGLFLPAILEKQHIFSILWFTSQFGMIFFLTARMKAFLKDAAPRSKTKAEPELQYIGDRIVVRYRAFAEIERWFKHRLAGRELKENVRRAALWVGGPLFAILTAWAFTFVSWYFSFSHTALPPKEAAAQAASNLSFLKMFITAFLGVNAMAVFAYLRKPSHVQLGPKGIRFLWRHKLLHVHFDGAQLPWSKLSSIAITRPSGKTSPLDDVLCFATTGGEPLKLRMNSIDSVEAKEAILHAIKEWGSHVSRTANVAQALQPPADYSYTELWLQALAAPPKRERLKPLRDGATLKDGLYQVEKTLGVGGQGQAYLAADKRSAKQVVLKEFILPVYVDVSVRRTALEAFENEARILRALNHRQIVKLEDFFVEDHRAYLVLEHIDGSSLRDIVQASGPLPEGTVRMLAGQMCEILSYLHGLKPPVVHRDFTADNLILGKDGRLKLIDFNVAKQSENTTVGTVVGKHAYLPPEQFRGMPVPQSDIYALGASLFYLLTGKDPEPISCSHPLLEAPHVSKEINGLVEKATALDLSARYACVEQLAADLRQSDD